MRCMEEHSNIRKTHEKERDKVLRRGVNYQVVPWSNLPMTLETRCGRGESERRFFQLDRLRRLLFLFKEQDEELLFVGFPVPVGTGGDITLVVDIGLRVLDGKIVVLVPLLLPPLEVTSVAMGPPGKTYWKPGLKI
jgi:hypothetical protein